ncbi:MAG: Type III restriction enzyme, res subunit [Firmicutes bacterium ADurb.Bin193]|nr:MAG: Type III restriction enzyme, res subunit [Firmicutes bacterium ADurb.Bin193]
MKLKFKNQQFQTDAVDSVADLFKGQEKLRSTFEITNIEAIDLINQNELGIGNVISISNDALIANMHEIQRRNNLPMTNDIVDDEGAAHRSFCVEMETGTGKTYVYTKTIFELNKRYGFTKFIIVVPSVAIREGVYKSLQITGEHFQNSYDNTPCRYFIYNSSKLSDVRQFATSNNIEIMIINIDAFKKAENIINQAQDKLNGETAMRYIQDTNPIVIIDEPQSVDNTDKAKEAIASLHPSCVLRYSATHREKINLLYRLTPVDAYQMGLVKQICVSSNAVANDFNKPYVKLLSVSNENGFKAKIELDVEAKDGTVSRKTITVKPNDDLYLVSGERELYDGYTIAGIDCTPGFECIEFSNTEVVMLGKSIGSIDENIIKEAQIKRTIKAHLDKELRFREKGIKVLSLFFIDEVKKYRTPDGEKGIYAQMFERCYTELINSPKYESLKEQFPADVTTIHNGYFSQDKKGVFKDTKGDTTADYDTYNTIMKDKEWLLSYDCPLRFIFSHSALKEGWDNPNVFQICTLIDQKNTFTCRQKVGRGLRLCVDQTGERIEDKNINILHVMANESFAEFAETLQKEIENETGVKFGVLQIGLFSGMTYEEKTVTEKQVDESDAQLIMSYMSSHGFVDETGKPTETAKKAVVEKSIELPKQLETAKESIEKAIIENTTVKADDIIGKSYTETVTVEKEVTYDDAAELIEHFKDKGYAEKNGKMKDTMKNALLTGTLDLPKKFEAARERLENVLLKADNKVPVRDASKEVIVRLKKQVMISPEFMELWNKIKQKTTYRVTIDTDSLIGKCVAELKNMPAIPKARLVTQTADINIQNPGVTYTEREIRTTDLEETYDRLPYILGIISEETLIKKSTVARIITESGRAADFLNNPQAFMEKCLDIIKHNRHALAIDGISYVKLDGQEYYAQEIFDSSELVANLDKNAVAVSSSVYDHIIYDSSTIEKPFAKALDDDPDVKMFFKIPDRFKIDTPIGTYNPDWAVYLDKNGEKKMYFILETKGTTDLFGLRTPEQLKIHCGMEHFKSLQNGVEMDVATNWKEFRIKK